MAYAICRELVILRIPRKRWSGKRWFGICTERLEAGGALKFHLVGEPFEHQHGDTVGLTREAEEKLEAISDRSRQLDFFLEVLSS